MPLVWSFGCSHLHSLLQMEVAFRAMSGAPQNSLFELEDAFWAVDGYARNLVERGDNEAVRTIYTTNVHFVDRCSKLHGTVVRQGGRERELLCRRRAQTRAPAPLTACVWSDGTI